MNEFEIQELLKGVENAPEYFKRGLEAQLRKEIKDRANSYRQTELLEGLLEDSKNAIEQRDAMIHNMYKMITESDASDKVKSNSVLQIIALVNTLSDGKDNLIKMLGLKDML